VGYEPIDAEYEAQIDAVYEGVMEQYYQSEAYAEDLERGIDEFIAERQKSYYVDNPAVAESAFNLLAEARALFDLGHYGVSQVMAGAASELAFGDVLLKPMVYGLVHNDSIAPVVADIIENARAVYKFRALLIAIVSQFSGIDLTANVPELGNKSFWSLVNDVREQRNAILHRDQLLKVSKEDAEKAMAGAAQLLENVLPVILKTIGLHLHGSTVCSEAHPPGTAAQPQD